MYCVRKVDESYTWIGADARRLAMFEGVFGVPDGISYNSYLLEDEKTVLFDTVDASVGTQFFENLEHTLHGRKLDYLIVQHMEPDHAATMTELLLRHGETEILCSAMAKTMIGQFFGAETAARARTVQEGETLETGKHALTFLMAPMIHWPEVMMTYDRTGGILFTADAFGGFGALNGRLFADEVDYGRDFLDENRRYYANIVGKYGGQVQTLLKKAAAFPIRMLCPLHGFVWRKEVPYIWGKYDLWSRYEPETRGVLIAYASVYGHTENAANLLACRLAEAGVDVRMFDTSVTPASYIVAQAFRYSHLVFAATTYNAGVFVTMEQLLQDLAAHALRDRKYALIENGSWAPTSGAQMTRLLEPLRGMTELAPKVTLKSSVKDEQRLQIEALAEAVAADLRGGAEEAAPAEPKARFRCKICGYVYEGDALPEGYVCPVCGRDASYFVRED